MVAFAVVVVVIVVVVVVIGVALTWAISEASKMEGDDE